MILKSFSGETTGVNVLNYYIFSCSHCTLEALLAGDVASTLPYSDAAAQDALYNSSVKDAHSGSRDSGLSQFAKRCC